jgi:uncharacterized YigZ family protein
VITSYFTLARDGAAEVEVKRSRFRCELTRVEDEALARAAVDRARREHWDARHHCSAFVIGPDAALQRSNDDGEPAGTAGAPILEALRGHEVSDVAAVVTRWFGGVLLGSGGLVRAYGNAVGTALATVGLLERTLLTEVALDLDHGAAARVEGELRARGVQILGREYAAAARLVVGVPADREVLLTAWVAELTAGDTVPRRVGERWVDGPPDGAA